MAFYRAASLASKMRSILVADWSLQVIKNRLGIFVTF